LPSATEGKVHATVIGQNDVAKFLDDLLPGFIAQAHILGQQMISFIEKCTPVTELVWYLCRARLRSMLKVQLRCQRREVRTELLRAVTLNSFTGERFHMAAWILQHIV
jgi:hypothetical protein